MAWGNGTFYIQNGCKYDSTNGWKATNGQTGGQQALAYFENTGKVTLGNKSLSVDGSGTITWSPANFDLEANGNLGLGNTSPGYRLTVNGTAWVTSGAWSGSDSRWKEDVAPLRDSLSKVLALQGVSFNWDTKNYPNMGFTNDRQIGFIAQDVEKVIPEVVTTDPQGYKGIAYDKLTAVLVEAVKERQVQIDSLKAEVEALKKSKSLVD